MSNTNTNTNTNTTPSLNRPGYSKEVLILDNNYNVVGREKDHLHAKSLALELGHTLVEEC